jgi:tRNA(Ile)-lysidine synthetase-like protein
MDSKPIYIVAVSGGVDSVALLKKLVDAGKAKLIVAHFDHGIRPNSVNDREFVQRLAKDYGLSFEYVEGKLGSNASEAAARRARYDFLNKVKLKHKADAIVTAHHQDDVIETAIINILRGTKRRGLSSLSSYPGLIRPLLEYPKFTIVNFAVKHGLAWREDPSNENLDYLRNYLRQVLIPKLDAANPSWRRKFLSRLQTGRRLNRSIEELLLALSKELAVTTEDGIRFKQTQFANLPGSVGRELMRYWLGEFALGDKLSQPMVRRAWLFAKTAKPGASLDLAKSIVLLRKKSEVLVTAKTSG